MTSNDRMKEIRKFLGMSQAEFAAELCVGQAAVSAIELGKRHLTERNKRVLHEHLNVNSEWLETGEGSMFAEPKQISMDDFLMERGYYDLFSDFEIDFMQKLVQLPKEAQIEVLEDIVRNRKKK